jgi:hypothetical protein
MSTETIWRVKFREGLQVDAAVVSAILIPSNLEEGPSASLIVLDTTSRACVSHEITPPTVNSCDSQIFRFSILCTISIFGVDDFAKSYYGQSLEQWPGHRWR